VKSRQSVWRALWPAPLSTLRSVLRSTLSVLRSTLPALALAVCLVSSAVCVCATSATSAPATLGLTPEALYELSMAPTSDYEARIRMWNPSTAEVWVDAARADGITVYSMCASGYIASLALADGMRVFYGTPLNGTSSGSPADMTRFPAAGPRIQALASLAGPLRYDSALMSENYTFTACQGASVAGRDTIELRIDPKWPGNVRRTVWVDFYAGTALRVEDRNYRGDLIWLWEVERIAFGPPRRQIMQAARAALSSDEAVPYSEPSMSLGEISRAAGFRVTLPAWVPEGYRLVALRPAQGILDREEPGPGRLRLMARMTSVAQLIYSDGLGAITFYQRPVPWWARRASAPRVGHAIEWERNGIRYVLVGDVDPQLLLKMARSL